MCMDLTLVGDGTRARMVRTTYRSYAAHAFTAVTRGDCLECVDLRMVAVEKGIDLCEIRRKALSTVF